MLLSFLALVVYSRLNAEFDAGKNLSQLEQEALQKRLSKAERSAKVAYEQLSLSENELHSKKEELRTALNTIVELQKDSQTLKEELVRTGVALKTLADDNFELKEFLRLNSKKK